MITNETLSVIALYTEGAFDDAESVEELADWLQEHHKHTAYEGMEDIDLDRVDWARAAMTMMRRPELPGVAA